MPLRQLNRKEREDIIIGARGGEESKIEMLIESFMPLKKDCYKKFIHEKDEIFEDDYYQECDIKILYCINKLNETNYGSLRSLVKKSIKHLTIDILRKNKRYRELNIICLDIIHENEVDDREHVHNFDNLIVDNMVVYESYHSNIKHQLSPKENDIFFSHIAGESFEVYAYRNGMKLESVKRIFRNAVRKIGNKDQIKKFHCIEVLTLVFIRNIAIYIGLANIADLMIR